MRIRTLDGIPTAVVGSGDVSLARSAMRGVDRGEVEHAVHAALSSGVTVVECAAEADAEQLVGEAVRELRARDRAIVATRVAAASSALALARTVQAAVEGSLRSTRLDALPLATITLRAAWLDDRAWPELAGTCARLVHDGKVMRWCATLAADDAAAWCEVAKAAALPDWLAALRVELSLCDRRTAELVDHAGAGRPVLVAYPLAGGALAGTLGAGTSWRVRDDRRAIAPEVLERVARGVAELAAFAREVPPAARSTDAGKQRLERLVRVEPVECRDVAELALRWAIDRVPGGGIALPRLHRRDHVAAAIAAAAAPPLGRDLLARLADIDI